MEYLVTPPEQTDWTIDPSNFIRNLLVKWPDANVEEIENIESMYSYKWTTEVSGPGLRVDGALHRSRQGISLDGYIEDCAEVAVWFRTQIPSEQHLIFYDQGFNSDISVDDKTSTNDIIKTFTS